MKKLIQFSNFKYNKFNPSLNEWFHSIYSYNKNHLNFSFLSINLNYLLNSYFNMKLKGFFSKEEKSYNLKRIYVSSPDIKYSINNINIFVYVFNKEKLIILNKVKKIKIKEIKSLNFIDKLNIKNLFNKNLFNLNKCNIEILSKLLQSKFYKLYLYKLYINNLYLNKYKFNNINILNLKNILYKLYKKNINIHIVNIKYLYLNNNLFMDAIVRKLKDRNRKALVMLRKAFALVNIPLVNSIFLLKMKKDINYYSDMLSTCKQFMNKKLINMSIFESLKNTHLIGIRLIGKGRLTRRLTASRAILKRTYVGNLKNIYSIYRGLSISTSKGFEKSNIDYISGNSHNRNGSFGIKSWQNTL